MKRFAFFTLLTMIAAHLFGASKAPLVTNVEPPCWWVGMANDTLQLMLTGPGIADAEVSVDYPGVRIDSQLSLDSRNYKFVYLTIAPDAKPGTVPFRITLGRRSETLKYDLRARRENAALHGGFSAADVLYLIMPDRFARGSRTTDKDIAVAQKLLDHKTVDAREKPNARHGGNIAGIEEHLDYLDSLGITALWVCPVLENDMPGGSYHGYATTDYYRIDPRFGTNEDWNRLIAGAHERGLKVVMDMIFNHSGSSHPWMADAPSKDWYNNPEGDVLTNFRLSTVHDPYVSDYDKEHTVNGWFVKSMPDLNQRNPHLMKYLTQNSIWWIESSGIDGIRMDTYPYADMEAMAGWVADVLREYPQFNIVGECWYGNEAGGAFWQRGNKLNPVETNLPTVMDFKLVIDGHKMFDAQTDPWNGLNHLYDHLALDYLYPDPQHILTFLDNHDTDRFLLEEPENLGVWKQAIAFLLTSRGIPQLYYGTEILMHGSKEGSDGYVRRDFPGGFPGDTTDAFTVQGRSAMQNEAWDYLSRLLQWRRGEANDVIAKGTLKHFMPQHGIYVYERRLGDRKVVVILNGNDSELKAPMDRSAESLPIGSVMNDLISGRSITIEPEMTFAPRQVMILTNF